MRLIRFCKTVLVASVAFLFSLFAFGNVTDYSTNWSLVQHVLSMDTIPDSTVRWRAITSPSLQAAAYWGIIGWEALTAIVLWVGAARLLRGVEYPARFTAAKPLAVGGLTLGIVLYAVGFVAIGGEWFAMWQSASWDGEPDAFRFIGLTSAVLIVLLIPEPAEAT